MKNEADLRDDGEPRPERCEPYGLGVDPVDGDRASLAVHHAEQHLHEAAFAAARTSHDADLLPRPFNVSMFRVRRLGFGGEFVQYKQSLVQSLVHL